MSDTRSNLPVVDTSDGTPGSVAPSIAQQIAGTDGTNLRTIKTDTSGRVLVDLNDGSGNSIASINSQIQARDVINVSSQYRAQSVTTTAAEAIGGSARLVNRKVICITPTNGIVYWGTNSSVTITTGTPLSAFQTLVLSFTDNVPVYVVAAATTDTRILEGS